MGVTPKVYTKEDVKALDAEGLRTAVPEILKAFNEDRGNLAVWEVYHEAAMKLESLTPCLPVSHAQYLENLRTGGPALS